MDRGAKRAMSVLQKVGILSLGLLFRYCRILFKKDFSSCTLILCFCVIFAEKNAPGPLITYTMFEKYAIKDGSTACMRNWDATGLIQKSVGQQHVLDKAESQRRSVQTFAPLNADLSLRPCVLIYDGICHLCNAGNSLCLT